MVVLCTLSNSHPSLFCYPSSHVQLPLPILSLPISCFISQCPFFLLLFPYKSPSTRSCFYLSSLKSSTPPSQGDIGHFTRHTHVYYKHRARARPVLSRTNDSDSDIVTPYNKNLSVSSAFTHGSGIHESRSMEDLLKFSDSEKVLHKCTTYFNSELCKSSYD